MNEPSVLLADEPTGNLDTAGVEQALALSQRLRQLTIVMVTHDPDVAATADLIFVIRDGRIVYDHGCALSLT